ncbi:amino acid aminotransferase [Salinibius halmophilus]|uniref:amino acid aminotransferase n=1 Tax=Salinibius halmophilus TaxID=1853216 RepID=UPI000E671760|nr:amino acid aminotransferase [Salinibius halmophilus]
MFEKVQAAPADPILGLTDAYKSDTRANKVNLGVGVYKDSDGATPILATVKKAEALLVEKEISKTYLSIEGTPAYNQAVQKLLFGADSPIIANDRARTAQAPGGTGALRIAAEFMVRQLGIKRIWVSNPTWANHGNIFTSAGLEVVQYAWYDADTKGLDFDGLQKDLANLAEGDAVLLHGCCHNPTGIDPTLEQWQAIANLVKASKALPLFDFAYQGFATGIDEDAASVRLFADQFDELLVANSFSKNFGLYNERAGAVTLVANDAATASQAFSQVKSIIRGIYSNPPSHGALVVATILEDEALTKQWQAEVAGMRVRIKEMRDAFVAGLAAKGVQQDFGFISEQNGMFSFSGLTPEQVAKLKDEFAIYIVGSGRISVAGITPHNIEHLIDAVAAVL